MQREAASSFATLMTAPPVKAGVGWQEAPRRKCCADGIAGGRRERLRIRLVSFERAQPWLASAVKDHRIRRTLFFIDELYLFQSVVPHNSLHRDTLRQIPRLIHIRPPRTRRVIRQQLQRDDVQDGRENAVMLRHADHMQPDIALDP